MHDTKRHLTITPDDVCRDRGVEMLATLAVTVIPLGLVLGLVALWIWL